MLAAAKRSVAARLEESMLRGVTDVDELITITGGDLNATQIGQLRQEIYDRWAKESPLGETEVIRNRRRKQLELVASMALDAFENSTIDEKQVIDKVSPCGLCRGLGIDQAGLKFDTKATTALLTQQDNKCMICGCDYNLFARRGVPWKNGGTNDLSNLRLICQKCSKSRAQKYRTAMEMAGIKVENCTNCDGTGEEDFINGQTRFCSLCRGSGLLDDVPTCSLCSGSGKIHTKQVTTKTQPGEPAFLKAAQSAFIQAAKLDGIYPEKGKTQFGSVSLTNTVNNISSPVAGNLQVEVQKLIPEKCSDDLLIEALSVINKIESSHKKPKRDDGLIINSATKVIDDQLEEHQK